MKPPKSFEIKVTKDYISIVPVEAVDLEIEHEANITRFETLQSIMYRLCFYYIEKGKEEELKFIVDAVQGWFEE